MNETPTVGIAAIFKNEAPYLVEWLAHHRLMGFKKFFVANNDSTDGTTELLDALQSAGYLVHHRFPSQKDQKPQVPAYNMLLAKHHQDVEWLAFIDADELIWPTEGSRDFPAFLAQLNAQYPNMGALALNWAVYGSSGHIRHDAAPMTTRFALHADQGSMVNRHIKSIIKTSLANRMAGPHHAELKPNTCYLQTDGSEKAAAPDGSADPLINEALSQTTSWRHFRINHYVIKSYSEFLKKNSRGRAFLEGFRDNTFFTDHDQNTEHTQPPADYHQNLDAQMHAIRVKAGLYPMCIHESHQRDVTASWSIPHFGSIDSIEIDGERIRLFGWAAPWGSGLVQSLKIRIDGGPWRYPQAFSRVDRPDVVTHHPRAPHDTGFVAHFDQHPPSLAAAAIEIRAIAKGGLATDPIAMGKYAREHLK